MTTFYVDDDDAGEPCIFAREQVRLEPTLSVRDVAVLRRSDLSPDVRRFWPDIVAGVVGVDAENADPAASQEWTTRLCRLSPEPDVSIPRFHPADFE